MKIKSQAQIAARYKDGIGRAPANYKEGIAATTDWAEKASSDAAEALYKEKLAESMAANRRQNAIKEVSNEEWKKNALDLGGGRIGAGMAANADKRTRNYEPFRVALEGVTLPERTADPMANLTNRAGAVVKTLVDKKKEIKG